MYFPPSKRENTDLDDEADSQFLSINGMLIKRVTETKFLGVIIDDKLSWRPHIASLNKKLRSICGRIYRIKKFLPESLYKQLYHSLFESHLGFAITVWGGVSENQLKSLFITQKKCIRILFGDHESYTGKFETCARARPVGQQYLGTEFHRRESTKPLFHKHKILATENLYRHRCLMELFKIVKYRVPISIYDLFVRSDRKETYIITPNPSHNFIYKSSWLWNEFRKIIGPLDFTSPISSIKNLLTKSLLSAQARHGNEWCNVNFTEF
jgi:hypothetical protein